MKVARDMLLLAAAALQNGNYDEAGKFFHMAVGNDGWKELAQVIANCCPEAPAGLGYSTGPKPAGSTEQGSVGDMVAEGDGPETRMRFDMGYPKQFGLLQTTTTSPVKVKGPKNEPSGGDPDYGFFGPDLDLSLDREEAKPLARHLNRTIQNGPPGLI